MTESSKTAIFAGAAGILILLAWLSAPSSSRITGQEGQLQVGSLLFEGSFNDASKAAALKITEFDEDKLTMKSFEVARDKTTGLWRLPKNYDYPADATDQVQKATTPLADLKILDVVSSNRTDQGLYGVVEPTDKLEAGVTGVGMLVNVSDADGKILAGLIIGKEDTTNKKLRFVRIPNQDPIYRVEIDPTIFATDFKRWIKGDLLGVKSFDITGVSFKDYEIERTESDRGLGARMSSTMEADVAYDTATSKWKLDKLILYQGGQPQEAQLAEGEELKNDKLNEVRNAAQNLQIVGVLPKPKGLAGDLKAEKELLESNEAKLSLFRKGFVPQDINGATEFFATSGETILTTQDGVQYVLRYGEQLLGDEQSKPAEPGKESAEADRERYLLVTAKLDESKFPVPDLKPVPETIEDLKKLDAEKAAKAAGAAKPAAPSDKAGDEKPAEPAAPNADAPAEAKPADEAPKPAEPKAEEAKSDAPPAEPAKTEEPKADGPKPEEPKAAEEPKAENSDAPKDLNECGPQPPAEPAAQPAAQDDKPAAQATATQTPAAAAQPPVQETEEELKDRLNLVREEITKSNQRLIDARNEKKEASRKKVQELNAKFADWYYVISENSFKQLRLKKGDFIGPKSAAPALPSGPSGLPGGFPGGFPGGLPNLPGAGVE